MGAVFYVNAGQATYCREQLTAAGFGRDVVEAEEDPDRAPALPKAMRAREYVREHACA